METYIVTLTAKPGHAEDVAAFYQDLEPLLNKAKGYHGRKIYQSRPGTMVAGLKETYSAEEFAKLPGAPHEDPGTTFIIVEKWDSVKDRLLFSKNVAGGRSKSLFPYLQPEHSHEFYQDITS
jgi:quinol monooxygenase YgiN